MTNMTLDELARLAVRLRLVEPWQLDECLSRLGSAHHDATGLLRMMESKNLLTSYQVSRIERGETDGLLLGDYKLMYRNASGSFARVFRACSVTDNRMVGLKVLRNRWAKTPLMVTQFHREAELCKKLSHKNIVPIYEVGAQGEFHYFTMEFVEGGNLRDIVNIRKRLFPAEATRCLIDMCEGLQYAVEMGITHRDLKPTNVLMSSRGIAKLVDFGLAGDEGISGRGPGDGVQRALEYATLEKFSRAPRYDHRSDLFFAGAIFYELLTGTPPYPRTRSRVERRQVERYKNIRPIREQAPETPGAIAQIVERLLVFDPKHRYQRAADVIQDLRAALPSLAEPPKPGDRPFVEPVAPKKPSKPQRQLPTIMCIESRKRQQDVLREYLSRHGFRVLLLSDLARGLNRLESNPPDCLILMGESIGSNVTEAFKTATQAAKTKPLTTIAVLAERQSEWMGEMEPTRTSRIMVQPITLRELRREIHLAIQYRLHDKSDDSGVVRTQPADAS